MRQKTMFFVLALALLFACTAPAQGAASPPAGWDANNYYFWIDKVWDSTVLPGCVPKELPGVQVINSAWKMPEHQTMNNQNQVGGMYFADSKFERWGLSFDCKPEQAEAFIKAMATNGFFGGRTNEHSDFSNYAWIGNGYYAHARIGVNHLGDAAQTGLTTNVAFNITPLVHPLPKSFNASPLPQAGAVLQPSAEWPVQYWDDQGNYYEVTWDMQTDNANLPVKNWVAWIALFDYFGVSNAEAEAYAKSLEAAGWKIVSQNKGDGESTYSCLLQNGVVWALLSFDGPFRFQVGFSDLQELLTS